MTRRPRLSAEDATYRSQHALVPQAKMWSEAPAGRPGVVRPPRQAASSVDDLCVNILSPYSEANGWPDAQADISNADGDLTFMAAGPFTVTVTLGQSVSSTAIWAIGGDGYDAQVIASGSGTTWSATFSAATSAVWSILALQDIYTFDYYPLVDVEICPIATTTTVYCPDLFGETLDSVDSITLVGGGGDTTFCDQSDDTYAIVNKNNAYTPGWHDLWIKFPPIVVSSVFDVSLTIKWRSEVGGVPPAPSRLVVQLYGGLDIQSYGALDWSLTYDDTHDILMGPAFTPDYEYPTWQTATTDPSYIVRLPTLSELSQGLELVILATGAITNTAPIQISEVSMTVLS